MDKVNILGVHVDMVNISQATDCIMRFLDEDKFHAVYTPNSEIIMLAYKDEKFCKLLNNADLLTADGIGVVHASKILKKPISERAAQTTSCSFSEVSRVLRKRQRKSFWKNTPTLILSVQETDISSLKKRLKLLRKSIIPVRILFLYA